MLKLQKNTSYINNWNYFSKSLILKENKDLLKSSLFIVANDKDLNNYEKIFNFLNIDFQIIGKKGEFYGYRYPCITTKKGLAGENPYLKNF